MPNTKTTTTTRSSVTQQQQQNTQVTNAQQQDNTSPNNNRSTSSTDIPRPAANVEIIGSNAETPNVEPAAPDAQSTSESIIEESTASTTCDVRKRRYTRITSAKLNFSKKQPRLSHAGQRRIRNIQTTRQDIGEVIAETLSNSDTENGANQDGQASSSSKNTKDIPVDNFVQNSTVCSDGIEVAGKSSPLTVSHVRKRRKTNNDNKMKQEGQRSKTTTSWKMDEKEIVSDTSRGNKLNENESLEYKSSSSEISEARPQNQKSAWENFCFSENWDSFKLPRIRRLGRYLQESMPSVSQKIRHCVSDLELSSVEEKRLKEAGSPKRSVSASDIASLDGNSMIMNEIYQ